MSLLYTLCNNRDIDRIKILLNNCNKIDKEAYFLVCSNGDIEILDLILNYSRYTNKLDIHIDNEYALKIACKNNRLDIIEYLIKFGKSINNRFDIYIDDNDIIKTACELNHIDIIKYLLTNYDTNILKHKYYEFLKPSCKYNNIDLVKYLIDFLESKHIYINSANFESMFVVVYCHCYYDLLKYLLDTFSSKYTVSPSYFISCVPKYDNVDILKLFFEYYKNISYKSLPTICNNIFKNACENGCINMIKYIIDYCKRRLIKLSIFWKKKDISYKKYDCVYENEIYNKYEIERDEILDNICKSDNIELITFLIDYYNYEDYINGFKIACCYKKYNIASYLLDKIVCYNVSHGGDGTLLFCQLCDEEESDESDYLYVIYYILSNKLDFIEHINIHFNDDSIFYVACCKGEYDIFIFLLNYYTQINSPFNISNNINMLLCGALQNNNIKLIDFLMNYNKEITTNALKFILDKNENNILNIYSIKYIDILKYIVEKCFYFNISLELSLKQYLSEISTQNINYNHDIINYIIYQNKHNYNKYNSIQCYCDIVMIYINFYQIISSSTYVFIKKYIVYTLKKSTTLCCNNGSIIDDNLYKYIINNCIKCINCIGYLNTSTQKYFNTTNSYILYLI